MVKEEILEIDMFLKQWDSIKEVEKKFYENSKSLVKARKFEEAFINVVDKGRKDFTRDSLLDVTIQIASVYDHKTAIDQLNQHCLEKKYSEIELADLINTAVSQQCIEFIRYLNDKKIGCSNFLQKKEYIQELLLGQESQEMINLLFDTGILTHEEKDGKSLLYYALHVSFTCQQTIFIKNIEYLLKNKANVNKKELFTYLSPLEIPTTPLYTLLHPSSEFIDDYRLHFNELVELFLKYGADTFDFEHN